MSNIINASLGLKTALLLGVDQISPKQAEDIAMTYRVSSDDILKAWEVIRKDFASGKVTRNRDIPKLLKEVGL